MNPKSPGYTDGSGKHGPGGTPGRLDAVHDKSHQRDSATSSTNLLSSIGLEINPAETDTPQSQSSTSSTFYSALRDGSPSDFLLPSRDTPHVGYLDHVQRDGLSQRLAARGLSQPEEILVGHRQRDIAAPATSRPSELESRQLSQHQVGIPKQEKNPAQPGLNHLRSSRDRVPTPGLSRTLGFSPMSQAIQDRSGRSTVPQKRGPSTAIDQVRNRHENIQYYDYSEGFEPLTTTGPHMTACQMLMAGPRSVESRHVERSHGEIPGNFHHGPHSEYGYTQVHARNDEYSYSHSTSQYTFTSPPLQGAGTWMQQDQRVYASHREPCPPPHPQPPRAPIQTHAKVEGYETYPHVRCSLMGPPQYRDGGNDAHLYPYTQANRGAWHGGSGYPKGRCELRGGHSHGHHEDDERHGQHQNAGRYHGRYREGGSHHQNHQASKGGFSNENVPPSQPQSFEKVAFRDPGSWNQQYAITQAHRRVHDMVKQLTSRRGQRSRSHDVPALRVSQPIPIMAPRPVACNVGRRLTENVLSIDDDEALPAGLRNLQYSPSGPSDDGLPSFDTPFLGQVEALPGLTNKPYLHPNAPKDAPVAKKTGLRRPRPVAQMNSTKGKSRNVHMYAAPKNMDFNEPLSSGGQSPYPAETLVEMEYQDIFRTQPKLDSSADSRSVTKPENDMWESAKARLGSTKEDMLARLGIKTRRAREAEKLGYTPLTRHAKATIPDSEHQGGAQTEQRRKIEQWIRRASNEDDGAEAQGTGKVKDDEVRDDGNDHQANMTTAARYADASPGVRERFMHLRMRAFRSKPELRTKM